MADLAELARILAMLSSAVDEARSIAKAHGISIEFRELTRHAKEMHELALECFMKLDVYIPSYLLDYADALGDAVKALEELAGLPDGKPN